MKTKSTSRQFLATPNNRHNIFPLWSQRDYFEFGDRDVEYQNNFIYPTMEYYVALNFDRPQLIKGFDLMCLMEEIAGSLFIPHVLTRMSFLKKPINEDFSN